jgi:glycosyltransferase involved in cell wall biosynthesis
VDGGSTDGTLDFIKSYAPKFKEAGFLYQWISEKDNGIYDAMNKGIIRAQGEIIGILNADDHYLHTGIFEIARAYVMKECKPAIYYGKTREIDKAGKNFLIKSVNSRLSSDILFRSMAPVSHPSTFVSREVYRDIGLFDTSYRISGDYEFIVRAYLGGAQFVHVDKIISVMGPGGASKNWSNRKTRTKEDYRIRRHYFSKRSKAATAKFLFKMSTYYLRLLLGPCLKYFSKASKSPE